MVCCGLVLKLIRLILLILLSEVVVGPDPLARALMVRLNILILAQIYLLILSFSLGLLGMRIIRVVIQELAEYTSFEMVGIIVEGEHFAWHFCVSFCANYKKPKSPSFIHKSVVLIKQNSIDQHHPDRCRATFQPFVALDFNSAIWDQFSTNNGNSRFSIITITIQSSMESRKEEVKNYLRISVNPIVEPMLQKIAKDMPNDVLSWMSQWVLSQIELRQAGNVSEDSESDDEGKQVLKRLQHMKSNPKKKNSRQAISAEVFGRFNEKVTFVPKVIPKDEQTQKVIRTLLENSLVFRSLEKDDLNCVINALEQMKSEEKQTIIKEGEEGDMLFIVGSGEYECTKVINGSEKYLKTYFSGQAFGQLSLMYNSPRAATIRCTKPGVLFGLDRATFLSIVQEAAMKRRTYINEIISKVGIFADIQPYEKEQLCDALKTEDVEEGQYVVKQGESGDKFYLVAEGSLIAEKQESPSCQAKKVFEYQEGDYFGEIALIKNTVRQASIKTSTSCKLMWIDRESFKRLLGPIGDILMRNMERYKKYMDQ